MAKGRLGMKRDGHDYRFTRRWFVSRNSGTFTRLVLSEWAGRPILYFEVGVYEGMSIVWMLQHVLTHPDSRAVGVDPWLMTSAVDGSAMEEVMRRAHHNTEPWRERCTLVRACSTEAMFRMLRSRTGFCGIRKSSVDLCMIDGNHVEEAAMSDARMVLPLMRPGGWILFDDVENVKAKSHHVKHGLARFLEFHGGDVRFLWKDRYMEAFERL